MKFIDTHCHPYLNKEKNVDEIINNFFQNDWEAMIMISSNLEAVKQNLEISKKHKNIFVVIWVHPCDVYDLNLNETIEFLEKIYFENKEKIVWIWECGLDYYRLYKDVENNKPSALAIPGSRIRSPENDISKRIKELESKRKKQKDFFIAQIELAKKLDIPLVIHNREAKEEIFEIIKETYLKNFIFHCYSEDLEFAKKLLEYSPDCKISFSWIVTFSNAQKTQETAKNIPLKNIIAETDSPYLTPVPFRWKEENEPIFTRYVIEKIAELRGEEKKYIYEEILKNSKDTFWLTSI
jgi:TatD DNase family protein